MTEKSQEKNRYETFVNKRPNCITKREISHLTIFMDRGIVSIFSFGQSKRAYDAAPF
jgi:hypothetical protein